MRNLQFFTHREGNYVLGYKKYEQGPIINDEL